MRNKKVIAEKCCICKTYLDEDTDFDMCPSCLVEDEDWKVEKFGVGYAWLSRGSEFTDESRRKAWYRKNKVYKRI